MCMCMWSLLWSHVTQAYTIHCTGQKNKEDKKLLEGVRIQAIESRSHPLQARLEEAKTHSEKRELRKQIAELRYFVKDVLWASHESGTKSSNLSVSYRQLTDEELFSLQSDDIDWDSIAYTQVHLYTHALSLSPNPTKHSLYHVSYYTIPLL